MHCFDAYYFPRLRFVSGPLPMFEVGGLQRGNLGMVKSCLGNHAGMSVVDIEPACRCYSEQQVTFYIGGRENRFLGWSLSIRYRGAVVFL